MPAYEILIYLSTIIIIGLSILDQVFRSLVDSTKEIKGAKVENNKFCVSVHYRNVDEKVGLVRSTRS